MSEIVLSDGTIIKRDDDAQHPQNKGWVGIEHVVAGLEYNYDCALLLSPDDVRLLLDFLRDAPPND